MPWGPVRQDGAHSQWHTETSPVSPALTDAAPTEAGAARSGGTTVRYFAVYVVTILLPLGPWLLAVSCI